MEVCTMDILPFYRLKLFLFTKSCDHTDFWKKQYCFARCFCIVKNFIQLSEVNRDDSETAMFTIMNVIKGIKMNEQTLRATMGWAKKEISRGYGTERDEDAAIQKRIDEYSINKIDLAIGFMDYETIGELFRQSTQDSQDLTVSERIWQAILEQPIALQSYNFIPNNSISYPPFLLLGKLNQFEPISFSLILLYLPTRRACCPFLTDMHTQ